MKRILFTLISAILMAIPAFAQDINSNPDNIIGEYLTDRGGNKSKVRVTRNNDGTYTAQVFWVEKPYDADGNKM